MRKYSEDYETVVTTDEKGRERETAVYRGDFFNVSFTNGDIVEFRTLSIILLALMIVFHVGAGFIDNQGMYKFYVALPYVFAFFPLLYLALGVFHLPGETRNYRRDEIGLSFDRIKTTSRVLAILVGIGVLGGIIYLLFFAARSDVPFELLFLLLEVLTFFMVFLLIRLQRRVLIQNLTSKHAQEDLKTTNPLY